MAKQIIILGQVPGATLTFEYALWLAVPAVRQAFYAKVGAVSVWPGASKTENAAIAAGQVTEVVRHQGWPTGTAIATIKAALQAEYAALQAQIAALNCWAQYGTFFDGVNWTQGGVA